MRTGGATGRRSSEGRVLIEKNLEKVDRIAADPASLRTVRLPRVGRIHASASAMRDRIDQPEARHAQQADKDQGNGVYDHATPVIVLAFRVFVFREVGNR